MEMPYFFWWLKYVMSLEENTRKGEIITVPEKFLHYRKEVPYFIETEETLSEIDLHMGLIEDYLDRYEETKEDIYLSEIEKLTEKMNSLTGRLYEEDLKFYFEFLPMAKGKFLEREADREVMSSPPLSELEDLLGRMEKDEIEEDELWDYLDVLRDAVYDIQDNELALMLKKESKTYQTSPDNAIKLSPFIDVFERALNNLEDSLEMLERAFLKKDTGDGKMALLKAKDGLVNFKAIEIMSYMGGVEK